MYFTFCFDYGMYLTLNLFLQDSVQKLDDQTCPKMKGRVWQICSRRNFDQARASFPRINNHFRIPFWPEGTHRKRKYDFN